MFKVTFKFENGEDVTTFAQEGEILLEVARKTNVAIDDPPVPAMLPVVNAR